jgi:DNA-binding transcriptional LysR family regulator
MLYYYGFMHFPYARRSLGMRLNLRQLETFRAVIESGSMTEGGKMLGISQPAVSRQIRDLESHFGIRLFTRRAGRIEPTKDAVALHEEVERCLGGLEQMAKFANDLGEFRRQRLRVAATVGHSYFFLPQIIWAFHQHNPNVTISLRSGLSPEVVSLVEKGQSDIGFAILPLDTHGVVIEPMPEVQLVCVMPASHPLSALETVEPGHLADVPLLLISENSLMRKRLLHTFQGAGIKPNVIMDSTYTGPICSLVAKGMGVSILDYVTAEAYLDHDIVIRPFAPAIPCELKLVMPAGQALSSPAQAFIKLAQDRLTKQLNRVAA